MPVISNLQTRLVRDANTALAMGLFPAALDMVYPKCTGMALATAEIEPFVLNGASPLPTLFNGTMKSQLVSSFSIQVPALLFKSYESVSRFDFELDQTRTVMTRGQAIGARLSQFPDFLFAKRLLAGDKSSSASTVYNNMSLQTTIDGLSFFNTGHTLNPNATQSNIVAGALQSTTVASLDSYDFAQQVQAMQRDAQQAFATFAGFTDDKGIQVHPNLNPQRDIVVVVPQALYPVAMAAFARPGAIIGGSPGTTGSTGSTSTGFYTVKDIISNSLIGGCQDVESQVPGATVNPTYATQYYFLHVGNPLIKPLYHMLWRPKKAGETMPLGSNPEAEAEAAVNAAAEVGYPNVPRDVALQYAFYEVDTNFNAIGANAQASVVETESFFMAGRTRQNFLYGAWWDAILVYPDGYTS